MGPTRLQRILTAVILLAGCMSTGIGIAAETPQVPRDAFGFILPSGPPPRRIVSLSPNLTEMLFAIGVGRERIAGVTRYCDYPPETAGLPRIGGIVDPSVEGILSLHPDLVLATRGNPTAVLDRLRAAGLNVFAFDSQDGIERVLETMRSLLTIASPADTARARRTVRAFASNLACLKRLAGEIPVDARPSLYYFDPASPDWTAGPHTHVNEVMALAGGRNVAEDAPAAWPRYSVEALIGKQPDVIVVAAQGADTSAASRDAVLASMRDRPGWRGLSAVREGRLCFVPADWLLRPGPRVLLAVSQLGRCLHPELGSWECAQ